MAEVAGRGELVTSQSEVSCKKELNTLPGHAYLFQLESIFQQQAGSKLHNPVSSQRSCLSAHKALGQRWRPF